MHLDYGAIYLARDKNTMKQKGVLLLLRLEAITKEVSNTT